MHGAGRQYELVSFLEKMSDTIDLELDTAGDNYDGFVVPVAVRAISGSGGVAPGKYLEPLLPELGSDIA